MISVIVPVYNSGQYLENCLNSILAQSYTDIEIICVNDGSTDNSPDILAHYECMYPQIRVFTQENCGVSTARNVGLQVAQGELISFIDSDDELDPNMYQRLVELLYAYDVDIAHCGYKKIHLDGRYEDISGTGKILLQDGEVAAECLLTGEYFTGSLCTKIFKRELFGGVSFQKELRFNEDVLVVFEIFIKCSKTVFADEPLYHYYERQKSSCKTAIPVDRAVDCFKAANEMYSLCKTKRLGELAAKRVYFYGIEQYRALVFSGMSTSTPKMADLKQQIIDIKKEIGEVPCKYMLNEQLLFNCPALYRIFYKAYDRIRKPKWDLA